MGDSVAVGAQRAVTGSQNVRRTARGSGKLEADVVARKCCGLAPRAAESCMLKYGNIVALAVLVLSLLLSALQLRLLIMQPETMSTKREHYHGAKIYYYERVLPTQLVVGCGFFWLARDIPTKAVGRITVCLFVHWCETFITALSACIYYEPGLSDGAVEGPVTGLQWIGHVGKFVKYGYWLRVISVRIPALSRISKRATITKITTILTVAWIAFLGVCLVLLNAADFPEETLKWFRPLVASSACLFSIVGTAAWFQPFAIVAAEASDAAHHNAVQGAHRQAQECHLAALDLKWQLYGFAVAVVITLLRFGYSMIAEDTSGEDYYFVAVAVDDVVSLFTSLSFVGTFSGSLSATRRRQAANVRRLKTWSSASTGWEIDVTKRESDVDWSSKAATVNALSLRGFTLDTLLTFYERLGRTHMLHWNPELHTTRDVVRQAIIPASAEERCALATVMMQGEPAQPHKMVTHNWGNRFRDLVAAIIADALGEAEYGRVTYLLDHEIDVLWTWLQDDGHLEKTYWVCAFSVNQHATICHTSPEWEKDTVTKQCFPLCCCGLPKLTNGDAACEVDKFDDMMCTLSSKDITFSQVVAIDVGFTLFKRAWCVAELAAASKAGMPQKLQVFCMEGLKTQEAQLKGLRVQDMEASHEPDKVLILKKIGDDQAQVGFNTDLQHLIFEELLPAWRSIDVEERLSRLVNMARWHRVGTSRGSHGLYTVSSGASEL